MIFSLNISHLLYHYKNNYKSYYSFDHKEYVSLLLEMVLVKYFIEKILDWPLSTHM